MAEELTLSERLQAQTDELKLMNQDVKNLLTDGLPSQNTPVMEGSVAPNVESNTFRELEGSTAEGPKWKQRLDATLKNYDTIASRLPFPTANPILMKQRQTLQKRADGYSYLQGKSPRSIRWSDNFTNSDLIKAWKVQKNQFVGEAYGAANPQNVAQTNALAQALQLSSEDWQDMLKLHRASRIDWAFRKNAADFQKGWETNQAERMIAPIVRELQLENAAVIDDKGQISYDSTPPLMSLNTIRDRFVDFAAAYKIPGLLDPEIIKKATEMYTLSTPGIQYDTWYSPDGTQRVDIDKRDINYQERVLANSWSTKDPGNTAGDGLLGQQSFALPTKIMVADEAGTDSKIYKEFMAARRYFELPENYQVGSVRNFTINTSKDIKHIRALQRAGALSYKPTGSPQEAQFVGPGGFVTTYNSSNPVADSYYRGRAFKIGGQVNQSEGERIARVQRGELAENEVVKVEQRKAKANDLLRLAVTMQQWQRANPSIFGLSGSLMKDAQKAIGVGLDMWKIFQRATGMGDPATSVYHANTNSIAIANIIADLRVDPTLTEGQKEEYIANWTVQQQKVDAAADVLNGVARGAGGIISRLTGTTEGERQLAQIQIYELGMATQLARLWSTKDRLLKDIYTRATAASSMFTGSSEQVANRIETIIKVAQQKINDYDRQLNPGLISQQYKQGQYGHIIPMDKEQKDDLEAMFAKEYPKK